MSDSILLPRVTMYRPAWVEVYQTDPQFSKYPNIRHSACFALTIARSLACHFGMAWNHSVFLSFFERELMDKDTDVNNDMYVGDIQNYIDDFIGRGRVKVLPLQNPDYEARDDEFEWCWWNREGTNFDHAVQGNGKGIAIYDPWGGGSESVKYGRLVSKRIARLLAV
jgi:hypothetical protein